MKDNMCKGLIAAAGAAVGAYFGELLAPVLVLVGVMVLDYATGLADAWAAGELSSRTGLRGIVKKLTRARIPHRCGGTPFSEKVVNGNMVAASPRV